MEAALKKDMTILRWNGVSNDEGTVLSVTKKMVTVDWGGKKAMIKKAMLKWQKKYSYDKKEWEWKWRAPALKVEQTLVEKVEGDWIKTYRIEELVSMKLTKKAYKKMGTKIKKVLKKS